MSQPSAPMTGFTAISRVACSLLCEIVSIVASRAISASKSARFDMARRSTAYAPLGGRTPLDQRTGRRSRTISVRMPLAELGWKKEAVMSSIGSPKSM